MLSSRGVSLALQLALLAIVGRQFGVGGMGTYQLFVSWMVVVGTLGAFGAPLQNLREVAIAAAHGNRQSAGRTFRANLLVALVGAGTLSLVVLVASLRWKSSLVPSTGPEALLVVSSIAAILYAALKTIVEALKGAGRAETAIFLESGSTPGALALVLVVGAYAQFNISVESLLAAHTAALALSVAVASVAWLRVSMDAGTSSTDVPVPTKKGSRWFFGATTGLSVMAANLPIVIMPVFLGASDIGLYSVARKTVSVAAIILGALSSYFAPKFAHGFALRDVSSLQHQLRTSQLYSLGLYAPLFVVVLLWPDTILAFFGTGFPAASLLLIILAIGQLLNSATGLVGYFLNMVHKEEQALLAMGIAIVLFLGAIIALTPLIGVVGVAIATAFFMASSNLIALVLCQRTLQGFRRSWAGLVA